ncbi:MAG: pyridoxamine kinase [Candidatus Zophobacter franzmannii]|nr:pyridoxamine kinase [Candidatus Zophobacter franzmannii]
MINPIKHCAAFHDLSGYGRVSLGVVIPILNTMGIQVSSVPTAVLSTHTAIKGFKFLDLTPQMKEFISHWKTLNFSFDNIYSGFLGSAEQIDIVIDFIEHFRQDNQLVTVDPVMADNGELYASFTPEIIPRMRELVGYADLITPNITEAAFLLEKEIPTDMSNEQIKEWCFKLSELGPKISVITSIPNKKRALTSVAGYHKDMNRFWKVECTYLPAEYPGTGDVFTSVLNGSLMQGDSLPIALERAVQFVSLAIRSTFGYQKSEQEGVFIEKTLASLNSPMNLSTYQLME